VASQEGLKSMELVSWLRCNSLLKLYVRINENQAINLIFNSSRRTFRQTSGYNNSIGLSYFVECGK
jgi:hypothetical protein